MIAFRVAKGLDDLSSQECNENLWEKPVGNERMDGGNKQYRSYAQQLGLTVACFETYCAIYNMKFLLKHPTVCLSKSNLWSHT
jgi:hypothetical protein